MSRKGRPRKSAAKAAAGQRRSGGGEKSSGVGAAPDVVIDNLLVSATACLEQGEYLQAEQVSREVLRRDVENVAAHWCLGRALSALERHQDAVPHLHEAAVNLADRGAALEALSRALQMSGDGPAALECLRELVAERPGDAGALNNLGLAALENGALEEAESVLMSAFRRDPLVPGVCLNLSRVRRFGPEDDDLVRRFEKLLERPRIAVELRADIHFAIGKVHDDRGEPVLSFEHLRRANTLMKRQLEFDRDQYEQSVDWIIETFSADLFRRCSGFGRLTEQPVFVVGMPRSGTTLVEQVLAAHPLVYGGGELKHLDRVARKLSSRTGSRLRYPRSAADLDEASALESARDYLSAIAALAGGAPRVTDKLPTNFAHLGLAALIVPGCRVIHCHRDPMDLCFSIYQQQFAEGHGWAYDFDDIVTFYKQYLRLVDHWRAVLPLPMLDVRYERLVADQEPVTRELVEFCGLPWDPACLEFHRVQRKVDTASNWQVRQPMYRTSVGRAKQFEFGLSGLRDALQSEGLLAEAPPVSTPVAAALFATSHPTLSRE